MGKPPLSGRRDLSLLVQPGSGKCHRILVVDDEPDLERLVRQRMRREVRTGRYRLAFARNGLEALEMLKDDEPFDMVLSDINMPLMDGLTLLKQIPRVNPDLRAVIVSAYGDMRNIRLAMNRGAFDFVTKPIDFKDLRVTIERTLKNLEDWRAALASRDQLVALENELQVARRMQASILPTEFPAHSQIGIHAGMKPANAIGGDFYDVARLAPDTIGFAIADVSGKGIPAALFMMSSRTALKGASLGEPRVAKVLQETNRFLSRDNASMMFVTVLYAVFDSKTGEFRYSSGGHDPPLLVRSDGRCSFLPTTDGIALGVVEDFAFKSNRITLGPGDTVLLYTDGVTEAQNSDGAQFGTDRLARLFSSKPPSDERDAVRRVFEGVSSFAGGAQQFDDITCLAICGKAG